jgi:hypothetical protein
MGVMFSGNSMQSHGSFELSIKDQTLIVKAIGAWNYETAVNCGKEYKRLVHKLKLKPWACLVDLTEWELFTPDASDYIDELNEWGNLNNQKYEVVVCGLFIQQALLEKSHEVLTNVETKFSENLKQAYEWLETVGVMKT